MNEGLLIVFQIVVLIFSAVIHEVSHGVTADYLGDDTARKAGRLTLNPLKHLDPFGSFMLPLVLYFVSGGSFVFGWAKPVPYNPFNLKNPKKGSGLIALAGPLSNFLMALFFSLLLVLNENFSFGINSIFIQIAILINLSLMIFNLVPIPPLDGSKILFSLLPQKLSHIANNLERNGMWLFLIFLFFGFQLIVPVIYFLFNLMT
ncbi:MAG: site-2 protease family protein [Candidatus Paceibacterota bacterium]|jgi:Zn-dependent protease